MIPCVVFLSTQSINLQHVIHVQHMHEEYRLHNQTLRNELVSQDIIANASDIPNGKTLDDWTNCLLVRMNTGWQWPLHGEDIQTFLTAWRYWNESTVRAIVVNIAS